MPPPNLTLDRLLPPTSSPLPLCRMQPTALALGSKLGVDAATSGLMCEDAARGTSVAPVAQLLGALEPW